MGDFHFIVRHALTGIVLIFFIYIGLYVFHNSVAISVLKWIIDVEPSQENHLKDISSLIPLVVTAPVIGIAIQGIYTAYLHLRNKAFTDSAREQVAERVKDSIINNYNGIDNIQKDKYLRCFTQMPVDAIFVWLYHTDAPPHLIEWARRRRSYHYMGWNWAIATILGVFIGAMAPLLLKDNYEHVMNLSLINLCLILLTLCWIGGTIWLAEIMKRDVDSMELIWSCACLYPKVKDAVIKSKVNSKVDFVL